jgi:Subunit 11 of the general transcription factor TFIIH
MASPPPSAAGTASASSLPTPRHHPLKAASQKEIAFINYVDSKILHINRRYAKKFSSDRDEADDEARGYNDFEGVIEDVEHVLDTVWVSGTRKESSPSCWSLSTCELLFSE